MNCISRIAVEQTEEGYEVIASITSGDKVFCSNICTGTKDECAAVVDKIAEACRDQKNIVYI